jgi:antitoxin PrlF
MRIALSISERGTITLPKKLRDMLGLKREDQLIAETVKEGILLRPAVTLPIELYTDERIVEFNVAEAELEAYHASRKLASRKQASRKQT